MLYQQWTHRYRFTLVDPVTGGIHTGMTQTCGELSRDEVEEQAKLLSHGTIDRYQLVSFFLEETRKAPL